MYQHLISPSRYLLQTGSTKSFWVFFYLKPNTITIKTVEHFMLLVYFLKRYCISYESMTVVQWSACLLSIPNDPRSDPTEGFNFSSCLKLTKNIGQIPDFPPKILIQGLTGNLGKPSLPLLGNISYSSLPEIVSWWARLDS